MDFCVSDVMHYYNIFYFFGKKKDNKQLYLMFLNKIKSSLKSEMFFSRKKYESYHIN